MASKPGSRHSSGMVMQTDTADRGRAARLGAAAAPTGWIVLIGLMGAGKSAVGRVLAETLRRPHLDSDAEIEAAATMSIPEIFERDGETFFRRREAEVIERILSGPPGVLSTGGGAWLTPEVRTQVAARGLSVWLRVDLDLLWSRVKMRDTRPLLRTPDPYGTLARLMAERDPVYALADVIVDGAPGRSVEDMAAHVLDALAEHAP